jgi:hypothetical protein
MADVGIIEGELLTVQIGDGGSPETFTHPCLINTDRGISFTTNMTETEVPDCSSPSMPAKIVRKARSFDFTISGAGKVDKTSVFAFIQWAQNGVAKNVQVVQNVTGANGGWTGAGSALLQAFEVSGSRGDYQNVTLTIVPAGVWTWTQNA